MKGQFWTLDMSWLIDYIWFSRNLPKRFVFDYQYLRQTHIDAVSVTDAGPQSNKGPRQEGQTARLSMVLGNLTAQNTRDKRPTETY